MQVDKALKGVVGGGVGAVHMQHSNTSAKTCGRKL